MQHVSILRAGYALALAFILYAALAPTAPTDGFTSDKLNHMAAFSCKDAPGPLDAHCGFRWNHYVVAKE